MLRSGGTGSASVRGRLVGPGKAREQRLTAVAHRKQHRPSTTRKRGPALIRQYGAGGGVALLNCTVRSFNRWAERAVGRTFPTPTDHDRQPSARREDPARRLSSQFPRARRSSPSQSFGTARSFSANSSGDAVKRSGAINPDNSTIKKCTRMLATFVANGSRICTNCAGLWRWPGKSERFSQDPLTQPSELTAWPHAEREEYEAPSPSTLPLKGPVMATKLQRPRLSDRRGLGRGGIRTGSGSDGGAGVRASTMDRPAGDAGTRSALAALPQGVLR